MPPDVPDACATSSRPPPSPPATSARARTSWPRCWPSSATAASTTWPTRRCRRRSGRPSALDLPAGRHPRPRRSPSCAPSPPATASRRRCSAWATTAPTPRRSSCATCWRTRPGTPPTRRTSPRSARAGSRRCSTSRRWSADLTGLPTANASLLDEGTAAAEAMTLCRRQSKAPSGAVFVVDADCHPQTIAVVQTRALPLGLPVEVRDLSTSCPPRCSASSCSTPAPPAGSGRSVRWSRRRTRSGALVAVAADLLALTCSRAPATPARTSRSARRSASACRSATAVRTPATWPCATASSARSPAGWSASASTPTAHPAYRLALQTREQHIRREKATSNICTAQVLLAVIAGMYAVWHGPEGLTTIAAARTGSPRCSSEALGRKGSAFFDTHHRQRLPTRPPSWSGPGSPGSTCGWSTTTTIGISTDETTTRAHLDLVTDAFGAAAPGLGRPRQQYAGRACPSRSAVPARSCCTRCSGATTARPRCCATCASCRTRTSRWTGR